MTTHDRQRERLQRTIEWARRIEAHLADVRDAHLGEVHFRPSSTAISIIGLRPDRPQRGKSTITNIVGLAANFEREYAEHCVACDHTRETPEKRLQSFLLAGACRNRRHIRDLQLDEQEAPLLFVTDELSLPVENGEIVCDILALHGDLPAAIELKPARQMKRLVEQVTDYAALVDEHADLFGELYSVILGRRVELHAPCERWIVWPHPVRNARHPREAELAALGVRVVGYAEIEEGFEFKIGRAVDG
ncbi:MAG: hypothetical protein IPH07_18400 [Deltaproteobacteria bacterium]|nr:hypothetical protein [Deltaproteobacteria bacterium]MBK8715673.1 hypothetical protein [Deltaproteobacteria bacterium]